MEDSMPEIAAAVAGIVAAHAEMLSEGCCALLKLQEALMELESGAMTRFRYVLCVEMACLDCYGVCRAFLRKSDLPSPTASPWRAIDEHTLQSGESWAYLSVMSLDLPSFELLLSRFSVHFSIRQGSSLRTRDVLALVMHFLSSKMAHKYLSLIFCVSPSTISRYVRRGVAALHKFVTAAAVRLNTVILTTEFQNCVRYEGM